MPETIEKEPNRLKKDEIYLDNCKGRAIGLTNPPLKDRFGADFLVFLSKMPLTLYLVFLKHQSFQISTLAPKIP
jgi:hypothetical protein